MSRDRDYCINCKGALLPHQTKFCCPECRRAYKEKTAAKPDQKKVNTIEQYIAETKDGPFVSYGEWMAKKLKKI